MSAIKELSQISFSIASADDIRNKSVFELNVYKYNDNKNNTVYDPRGGSLFNKKCETCKQYEQQCPGHFAHIELNACVVNPILFTHVFNILKCICHVCSKLLITREHLEFSNILKLEGERRLFEITNKIKKFSKCFHCNAYKREYKIKKDPFYNIILYDDNNEISDDEIKTIFDDIDSETLSLLHMSHPKNCILQVFPVIPPCCRPYEFVGNNIKEDDLTKQLAEIVKANNNITTSSDKSAAIHNLKLKIETFCRTPKKKLKNINTEPIKGIRERLTGKDGQLRDNLMGKRTEMSGRTVIGPGPTLKLDEVGIPEIIAKNITFPIQIYNSNYEEIIEMVKSGLVEKIKRNDKIIRIDLQRYSEVINFLKKDDVILRKGKHIKVDCTKIELLTDDRIFRKGVEVTPVKIPQVKDPEIYVGDIVQRRIINGDWVLMNRQPTLWKGSMMSFKVVITDCKTFTFNLAVCKAFNSDFDGDEQNAHFPQSVESSIELQLLSKPDNCILSSSNGNPVIVILQDALLGAYLMSQEDALVVDEGSYNDIIMHLTNKVDYYLNRKKEIENTTKLLKLNSSIRSGRSILSLILPKNFTYITDTLKIRNGVLYDGCFNKDFLGSSKRSLIYIFKQEYGTEVCVDFINNIQFMTNKWLTYNSFSVNMADCVRTSDIDSIIEKKLLEANFIKNTVQNKSLMEAKTNIILSNAKDVGIQLSDDASKNNFVTTIKAGSKGDYFNLGQVKGLLGQQIINGKRVENLIDNGTRSLIHYSKKPKNLKEEYEARGFVMNSFYKGLNPKEFFFHSMSGRRGVIDTAMTTFMSGYSMRKLVKLTEDIKIQNDGTVSDATGQIYSYVYGDMGFNPETKGIDVDRILGKLNE